MGEVAAIETTMAAAAQKLEAVRTARETPVHLGMPEVRLSAADRTRAKGGAERSQCQDVLITGAWSSAFARIA